jgi:hypothetical protein
MVADMSGADGPTAAPLITACAWCKRVEVKDVWIDSDAGVRRFAKLFGIASPPTFTHGICPDCFAHLEAIRLRQARRAS